MAEVEHPLFSDAIENRIAEIVLVCNKLPINRDQSLSLAAHLVAEHFTDDEKEAWEEGDDADDENDEEDAPVEIVAIEAKEIEDEDEDEAVWQNGHLK